MSGAKQDHKVIELAKQYKNYKIPKFSHFAVYVGIFTLVISLVSVGYSRSEVADFDTVNNVSTIADNEPVKPSVDELTASEIAANVAEQTNMAVADEVSNRSVSLEVSNKFVKSEDESINNTKVIKSSNVNNQITYYKAKAGDTVKAIAKANGVSERTIKWANNLDSDAVERGRTVAIPPVDGVIHKVKSGDTFAKIAARYKADAGSIRTFNNLELTGLKKGEKVVVPGGILPENMRPDYNRENQTAGGQTDPSGMNNGGGSSSYSIDRNIANASAGNRYAFGNCTWYAYERRAQLGRPIGSFWGNANTWAQAASAAGFAVNGTPKAGAIFQTGAGYYGHVGIVEEVLSDGSVRVSEMNFYGPGGGFNVVSGRTFSAAEAATYTYIH